MKSLLHSLQGNESVLLMYLFDELPPEDRAEVDALLRTDANLQKHLDQLRSTHEILQDTLNVDGGQPTRSELVAARNAKREIERWNVERVLTQPQPVPRSRVKMVLAYSGGIAAAVILGSVVYWGMFSKGDVSHFQASPIAMQNAVDAAQNLGQFDAPADNPVEVASVDVEAEMLRKSLDGSEELNDPVKHMYYNNAEQEIQRATQLSKGDTEIDFGKVIE